MPPVMKLVDAESQSPTSAFPLGSFPFEFFNPVQSRVLEVYDKEASIVIASATSSGKTVMSEMFMAHEVRKRGGKAMYLAPMKALAKEKIDDWTANPKHHFADLKVSICTGDYRLTADRKKELEKADLIIMTSEMLNSRIRNIKSEKNDWLKDIGTLVVDEAHLLTVPSRGDHLEVGLMKFSEVAKQPRFVLLSATMPNVGEIADWVSYTLTGRDTYLLESTYRPCPLGIHYESYHGKGKYHEIEEEKINTALRIREEHADDKFLIFVHGKDTGRLMEQALKSAGFDCYFHKSDLDKDERQKLENDFRTGKIQTLVATSTLAWGNNLPARRVIITGVHRGLTEVENYDIWQMAGRAGRPGYDPRGDVYVLVPQHHSDFYKEKLSKPARIESRLLDYVGKEDNPHYKTLAFHIVSEIHHGAIKTSDDLHRWYRRSFAHFQANDLRDDIVEATIQQLEKCGAVKVNEEGDYEVSTVGKIASMFYYSPFDVADLRKNFTAIFEGGMSENDLFISLALGNIDSVRTGIANRAEKDAMSVFAAKVRELKPDIQDSVIKGAYCYFLLMNGRNLDVFANQARNLQFDYPRLQAVLTALDTMGCKWGRKDWFEVLQMRISYGVSANVVPLCKIPDVGKVRAEKLWDAGLKDYTSIANNYDKVKRVLNMSEQKVRNICNEARKLSLGF